MKLSKKEALVITMLAIVGIYQLLSWTYQGYTYLQGKQDKYYELRRN